MGQFEIDVLNAFWCPWQRWTHWPASRIIEGSYFATGSIFSDQKPLEVDEMWDWSPKSSKSRRKMMKTESWTWSWSFTVIRRATRLQEVLSEPSRCRLSNDMTLFCEQHHRASIFGNHEMGSDDHWIRGYRAHLPQGNRDGFSAPTCR
jgi:hypothetical protein